MPKMVYNWLVQMVPQEGELHSHMHLTPMRGTRALALRFLANKFGLDMTHFTVSSLPLPCLHQAQDKVSTHKQLPS